MFIVCSLYKMIHQKSSTSNYVLLLYAVLLSGLLGRLNLVARLMWPQRATSVKPPTQNFKKALKTLFFLNSTSLRGPNQHPAVSLTEIYEMCISQKHARPTLVDTKNSIHARPTKVDTNNWNILSQQISLPHQLIEVQCN